MHRIRCLNQLRSKDKNIEKYIYLSQLKDADPNMFYKLCIENMSVGSRTLDYAHVRDADLEFPAKEITPLIYTPTVGDACIQYSHIFRRPEGLVSTSILSISGVALTILFAVRVHQRQGQCWQGSQKLATNQ